MDTTATPTEARTTQCNVCLCQVNLDPANRVLGEFWCITCQAEGLPIRQAYLAAKKRYEEARDAHLDASANYRAVVAELRGRVSSERRLIKMLGASRTSIRDLLYVQVTGQRRKR